MNILFLCTANIQRSKTAELLFSQIYQNHDFQSAGLSRKYCEHYKSTLCTTTHLNWADVVFVMEEMHLERIRQHVGSEFDSKIINLRIDDVYRFNDENLIKILLEHESITGVLANQ